MDLQEGHSAFIKMQLASITTFNIRFSHHIMKIDENLHSILTIIEESCEELENTAAQQEKRIRTEFSRRFTRDYLYPTHLKMNELENEYLSFISYGNCKIAQSMVMRSLVLILLKKLSSSTQAYLQFVRKTRTKTFVKLKEVVHLISHLLEILKSIVDHRILKNNDIEKLCSCILDVINNENQKIKPYVIDRREKAQDTKVIANKPILKKISIPKNVKNRVHFTSRSETKILKQPKQIDRNDFETCCCSEKVSEVQSDESIRVLDIDVNCVTNNDNHQIFRNSISSLCSKISDLIISELVVEVVEEMKKCFHVLALDAFDLEFKS